VACVVDALDAWAVKCTVAREGRGVDHGARSSAVLDAGARTARADAAGWAGAGREDARVRRHRPHAHRRCPQRQTARGTLRTAAASRRSTLATQPTNSSMITMQLDPAMTSSRPWPRDRRSWDGSPTSQTRSCTSVGSVRRWLAARRRTADRRSLAKDRTTGRRARASESSPMPVHARNWANAIVSRGAAPGRVGRAQCRHSDGQARTGPSTKQSRRAQAAHAWFWAVAIVQHSGSAPASDYCFTAPERLLAPSMSANARVLTVPRSVVAMPLECGPQWGARVLLSMEMGKRQRTQRSCRKRRTGQRRTSCSWRQGTGPVKAAGRLISWVRRSRLGC
jgi:hypothetical protein